MFTGKVFYFPFTFTVASSSNSVVSQWDLIVGVAGYILKPGNNTLVLTCLREAWSTPCFTGVYVVNSNGKGFILIPSSNNNHGVLYTLNNIIIYSIKATIPHIIWTSLLAVYFTIILIVLVKSVKEGYKIVLRDSRVLSLAILIVLFVNSILVGAVYVDQSTPRYSVQGVSVKWSFYLENSTLLVTLDLGDIYTLESAMCNHKLQVDNTSNNYLETRITSSNIILVTIPGYIYEYLYNKTVLEPIPLTPVNLSVYATIPVYCEFRLDKGVFQVTFITEFYWRDLVVSVRDTLVEIYNPNPIPIEAKIFILDVERGRVVNSTSMYFKPLSVIDLDLSVYGAGKYRVLAQYTLLGLGRSRVAYVEVS